MVGACENVLWASMEAEGMVERRHFINVRSSVLAALRAIGLVGLGSSELGEDSGGSRAFISGVFDHIELRLAGDIKSYCHVLSSCEKMGIYNLSWSSLQCFPI